MPTRPSLLPSRHSPTLWLGVAAFLIIAVLMSKRVKGSIMAGIVFATASAPGADAPAYRVGADLVEPTFVAASATPIPVAAGDVEYLIWSETGKRIAALATGAGHDEILFAAGTCYRVLRVETGRPGGAAARVLLREHAGPVTGSGAALTPLDTRILDRLTAAAALVPDADGTSPGPAVAPPIGLVPGDVEIV